MEVCRELDERHGDKITAHLIRVEVDKQMARRAKVDCPACCRHVLADRIDAPRRHRPSTCPRCGNKMPVGNAIVDPTSERQQRIDAVALGAHLALGQIEHFVKNAREHGWTTDEHGRDLRNMQAKLRELADAIDLINVSGFDDDEFEAEFGDTGGGS
jgi:hypothetical protein